jgi:hypothetical protein
MGWRNELAEVGNPGNLAFGAGETHGEFTRRKQRLVKREDDR